MTDEKFILTDRVLTREVAHLINALKEPGLTEGDRQHLRNQLQQCLDQLTAIMGMGGARQAENL